VRGREREKDREKDGGREYGEMSVCGCFAY
jgi:hypothetical protein